MFLQPELQSETLLHKNKQLQQQKKKDREKSFI